MFNKKEYICCDYSDLEDLINKTYGGNCEIPDMEEAHNYSSKEIKVDGLISVYQTKNEAIIREGKYPSYSLSLIMNMLCKDGLIESGNYLINISW